MFNNPSIAMVLSFLFFIIFCALCLLAFALYQIKINSTSRQINKPIEEMSVRELQLSLQREDLSSIRWIEDIIEKLVDKQVLELKELPLTLQFRLDFKSRLRSRLAFLISDKISKPASSDTSLSKRGETK